MTSQSARHRSETDIQTVEQTAAGNALLSADQANNTGHFPAALTRLERLEAAGDLRLLPSWALALRQAAQTRFLSSGLPRRGDEEWRYTNIKSLGQERYTIAQEVPNMAPLSDDLRRFHIPDATAHEVAIVFVDGVLATDVNQLTGRSKGWCILALADACMQRRELVEPLLQRPLRQNQKDQNPFAGLNQAFLSTGIFIEVEHGQAPPPVLHLIYLSSKSADGGKSLATFPRSLIVLGQNAQLTIVETYAGEGSYLCTPATDIALAAGARLNHVRIQAESAKAQHIGMTRADLGRAAHYESFNFSIGAKLCRHDLDVTLTGEGAHARLDGLYLGCGEQHVDQHTTIDHCVPAATSSQHYKGILDEKARGVFNGKVFVRSEAQKTSALQLNNNLLLSNEAEIDTKPELQINADDVKCSHGATIGRLNSQEIFYLMSRGLPKPTAESLLCQAFAGDVIMNISCQEAQKILKKMVAGYFNL